jgi:DNA helicase-2/ATP-dependent DNA helicase PcrA
VDQINYWSYLVTEFSKNEKIARWRFSNIEYFIQSIENWEKDPDNYDTSLFAWLNRVSLITSYDDREDDKGKVNLSTIHAAKGLEFPVVFIAGAEDGIIPHTRSLEENGLCGDAGESGGEPSILQPMEEERRLFYVAITRARDKLYITSCQRRRRFQDLVDCTPSPFLEEIPPHLMETPGENESNDAEMIFAKAKERFK